MRRTSGAGRLLFRLAVAAAIAAAAAGCARPGKGKVSGRVLLDGRPLPGGHVFFRPVDPAANLVTVTLDEGGNYSVELPEGETYVAVDNRALEVRPAAAAAVKLPSALQAAADTMSRGRPVSPPAAPRKPSIPGTYTKIPVRYYTAEESGLSFTVARGDTTHDIELTSQ